MSSGLIILVAIIYLYVGVDLIIKHQYGLGLTFICYAASNVGLYLVSRGI